MVQSPQEEDYDEENVSQTEGNQDQDSLSLADQFDSVPLSKTANDVPAGKYEAIIRWIGWQEPTPKGQSIRVNFDLVDQDLADQNQVPSWFRVFDGDKKKVDWMIESFKRSMAKLGYDDVKFSQLPEIFNEINGERPGVLITISYSVSKSDGNTYQRVVINDLCNNDLIEEYKDNVPY